MPIIVSRDGKDAQRVAASAVENEDFLQRYIAENPNALPLDDIKDDLRLMVIGREFPTRSGPIDVLAVDSDGDIYVIETKLFQNPDKRRVIAQILDYGASLWKGSGDPSAFIGEIESRLAESFALRLQGFFNLEEGDAADLVEQTKRNIANGEFRFVVLMDQLHDALRDLILFLNERCSFTVYAVEMELYRHEGLEIVIPKLFGAEVRKEVRATGTAPIRRAAKWTLDTFLQQAASQIPAVQVELLRRAHEAISQHADRFTIDYGYGRKYANFFAFPREGSSKEWVIQFMSDGSLILSVAQPSFTDTLRNLILALHQDLIKDGVVKSPRENQFSHWHTSIEHWGPQIDALLRHLHKHL